MADPYGALWPRVLQDSGVAGYTVATPHLITVMWARPLRVQSRPAPGSRSSCGRLLGVGPLGAGFLESAILWFSSGRFLRPGRLPGVGSGDSRPGEGGPVLWMLEGSIDLIIFEEPGGVG